MNASKHFAPSVLRRKGGVLWAAEMKLSLDREKDNAGWHCLASAAMRDRE